MKRSHFSHGDRYYAHTVQTYLNQQLVEELDIIKGDEPRIVQISHDKNDDYNKELMVFRVVTVIDFQLAPKALVPEIGPIKIVPTEYINKWEVFWEMDYSELHFKGDGDVQVVSLIDEDRLIRGTLIKNLDKINNKSIVYLFDTNRFSTVEWDSEGNRIWE